GPGHPRVPEEDRLSRLVPFAHVAQRVRQGARRDHPEEEDQDADGRLRSAHSVLLVGASEVVSGGFGGLGTAGSPGAGRGAAGAGSSSKRIRTAGVSRSSNCPERAAQTKSARAIPAMRRASGRRTKI